MKLSYRALFRFWWRYNRDRLDIVFVVLVSWLLLMWLIFASIMEVRS